MSSVALAMLIVISILIFLGTRANDQQRIRHYLESRGDRLLDIRGSVLSVNRIYSVSYLDKEGSEHEVLCKTSGWSGVWFRDDVIVKRAHPESADERITTRHHDERFRRPP